MRVSVFLLTVAIVVLGLMWWISMGPARGMISRVHSGMSAADVMDSGSGWISCTLRGEASKNGQLRFMAITSPAGSSVSTTSSTFPEDKPTRTWTTRRQFSNDLERRIRASGTPWEAEFTFTGFLNRSNFVVTFGPDAKVSSISMLHMEPARPNTDPLAH
ncbi:MAG TPA: hypothetical protein VFU86_19575 [Terriglobales bacterium]|nr:hypothetical protein [Terriglobales bacterium]